MNTLELHPWGATVDDPEHPDRLVFDLDPGDGVSWAQVKAGARDVRDRLLQIGLQSFVRLSGGRGVHVVVPLQPKADWEQAKAFCEAFAQAMALQQPDRYVATMSKAKRSGRVFVVIAGARERWRGGAVTLGGTGKGDRRRCVPDDQGAGACEAAEG
ncbi:hypothetical protein G6F24_015868 [Rhizopus arrhizus]|nr:hypothetical protein G6F24_015868 [Rhizopus arrhizus]